VTLSLAEVRPIEQDAATRDARHHSAGAWREVSDWLSFLELEDKSPRTLDDYERTAAVLLREYPEKCLADLTDADLGRVLLTFPPGSRRTRRAHLSSLFKWAYLVERIDKNPMERVPRQRRPEQKIVKVFSDADIEMLTGLPSPDGTLFQILFDAGIRKGEARRLQVKHVNLERRTLSVFGGKGDKDRVVPFGPVLAQRIADSIIIEGLDRDDYFWWCKVGNQIMHDREIGECSFHAWYGKCIALAGVTYRKPHTTRHTFATRWLRRGGGYVTLSKAMGHASIQTTVDEYGHLDVSDIAADLLVVEGVGG